MKILHVVTSLLTLNKIKNIFKALLHLTRTWFRNIGGDKTLGIRTMF